MTPFNITRPVSGAVPIVLSIPHCGSHIPAALRDEYDSSQIAFIDDTDWFVDRLYAFAPEMGITVLSANISRWVIDLNRDPANKPLYSDGRVITALCPTTDFMGTSIYNDKRVEVDSKEVQRRIDLFYQPYHDEITRLMDETVGRFGRVLLWECHSIRQSVPAIHPTAFPDLILGDADGTSASPGLSESTLRTLEGSGYSVAHNHPFKGGYITRNYAHPANNRHTLQLEMTKVNYMDDTQREWDTARASKIQTLLQRTFDGLIGLLSGE